MPKLLRSALAVVAGVVVAGVLIAILEAIGHTLFPLPEGIDPTNPEHLRTMMDRIPLAALLSVLFAWGVANFVGAFLAGRIAGREPVAHGMGVFLVLFLSAVTTMLIIPHPVWFWAATIVVLPLAAIAGGKVAGRALARRKDAPPRP